MSIVLVAPEHDVWQPGQHTGTFRGNNLAFVAATALLEYWRDDRLVEHIARLRHRVERRLSRICDRCRGMGFRSRGRGLIQGLDVRDTTIARRIIDHAFEHGLLIESSGPEDEVLKIMPALTSDIRLIEEGLDILERAIHQLVPLVPVDSHSFPLIDPSRTTDITASWVTQVGANQPT